MQRCRDALMQVVGLPGVDALALAVGSSWGKRKWRSLVNHWINYSNLDKYIVNLINMFWLIIVSFILSFQICCGLMDFWGFDCLILGHLQVLFVLCRWRTTDTKSSHRTNTTGLTRSVAARPGANVLMFEPWMWAGGPLFVMWCHVKILVGKVQERRRPIWNSSHEIHWMVSWSNCQIDLLERLAGARMVAACVNPCTKRRCGHATCRHLDILCRCVLADRALQHPQLHAEQLSRWCMGNVAGAKPGTWDLWWLSTMIKNRWICKTIQVRSIEKQSCFYGSHEKPIKNSWSFDSKSGEDSLDTFFTPIFRHVLLGARSGLTAHLHAEAVCDIAIAEWRPRFLVFNWCTFVGSIGYCWPCVSAAWKYHESIRIILFHRKMVEDIESTSHFWLLRTHWIRRPTSVVLLLRAYPGQWSACHVLLRVCTVRCLSSCPAINEVIEPGVMQRTFAVLWWCGLCLWFMDTVECLHQDRLFIVFGSFVFIWFHLSFCIECHWFSSCHFTTFNLLVRNIQGNWTWKLWKCSVRLLPILWGPVMESSADRDESPFNSQTLIRGMAVEVMSNRSISKDLLFSKK